MKDLKTLKNFKIVLILLAVVLVGMLFLTQNKDKTPANMVNPNEIEIIFFYSPSCGYCHQAMNFLAEIKPKYPDLVITKYNTVTAKGQRKYLEYKEKYKVAQAGVPLTILGDKYVLGFSRDKVAPLYLNYINSKLVKPIK